MSTALVPESCQEKGEDDLGNFGCLMLTFVDVSNLFNLDFLFLVNAKEQVSGYQT